MERAVVEGALEAARKDNSRLQGEVGALRSTLRRGAPLEELPPAPQHVETEAEAELETQGDAPATKTKSK